MAATLFDKLWHEHEVMALSERESLLYIDRIFLHERTGSVALNSLLENNRVVRRRQHAAVCSFSFSTGATVRSGRGTPFVVEPLPEPPVMLGGVSFDEARPSDSSRRRSSAAAERDHDNVVDALERDFDVTIPVEGRPLVPNSLHQI